MSSLENIKIEQYKICVGSTEKHNEYRHKINNFFLGINTSLVVVLNYLCQPDHDLDKYLLLIPPLGFIASILWIGNLITYRNISREKHNEIKKIEKDLPYKPFTESWEVLKGKTVCGIGHIAYSKFEILVALLFSLLFVYLTIDVLNIHICCECCS
tara:strand:- start:10 stop:477 length:468 start_codon:yes stop_codon:yes gene_type:complete